MQNVIRAFKVHHHGAARLSTSLTNSTCPTCPTSARLGWESTVSRKLIRTVWLMHFRPLQCRFSESLVTFTIWFSSLSHLYIVLHKFLVLKPVVSCALLVRSLCFPVSSCLVHIAFLARSLLFFCRFSFPSVLCNKPNLKERERERERERLRERERERGMKKEKEAHNIKRFWDGRRIWKY